MFSRLLVTAPFAFCVTMFEAIEIQTCSEPQNDRLNLSFVKDNHVLGKKWLERVGKWLFISRKFWESPSKLDSCV